MAKLAIAPPVDEMVKPVATVLAVLVSDDDVRVKTGAVSGGAEDGGEVEVAGAAGADGGEVEVAGATGSAGGRGAKVVICFDGADDRLLPTMFVALIVKV